MPRWPADAAQRLAHAALDLFVERGYDETTVAEIARRAGLSESTFFRHYPDKREALFLGQDVIGELMGEGIAGVPSAATPITLVAGGVMSTAAAFPADRREFVARRRSVIVANPELQEREERKRAGLRASIVEALLVRGVDEPTAALAAHFGGLAFSRALARWAAGDEEQFADAAQATIDELRGAAETLVADPPDREDRRAREG